MKNYTIRAYGILINEDKELLVSDELIKGMKFTKYPGGGLEWGEGLKECLIREFMEELGQPITVTGHYYTTDFFQQSAFHKNHQLISVYFRVALLGEPVFQTRTKPFDFPQGQTEDTESFRWVPLENLSADDFRWPVDRIVTKMLLREYKINTY